MKQTLMRFVKSYLTPENIDRAKLIVASVIAEAAGKYVMKHTPIPARAPQPVPEGSAQEFEMTDNVG